MNLIFIGLGGGLGAILRYLISLIPLGSGFPFNTLITNIIGAAVIGYLTGYFQQENADERIVLFFKTGLCGGFTTFSTFSLEMYNLIENGRSILGITYGIVSLLACLIGVFAGIRLSQMK